MSRSKPVSTETFEQWLTAEGHSANTIKAYLADLRVFIRWYGQVNGYAFNAENLTGHDIRAWRAHTLGKEAENRAPSTWNRRKASIAVYIQYQKQIHGHNSLSAAMRGVKPAAEVIAPPGWLTAQEISRLMRGLEQAETRANTEARKALARRDVAMMILMLDAGLRESEVTALTMADVNWTERKCRLSIDGKGEKKRQIPIGSEARFWLRHYLDNLPSIPGPRDRLFPVNVRDLQKRVTAMGLDCRIVNLHPHRFRHVSVKRMVRAGVDLETIRKYHGHSKIEITMRYAAAGWEELEDAAERGETASLPKGLD